jgi:ABC-2 type transport system permease protein
VSYRTLFGALARKRVVILKEYPVNTLTQLAVTYLFFAGIFFGGKAVAGPALTDSLPGIIVGFFVWTMAITAFAGASRSIMQEAQWGTLEQLYMSPYGFERVMAVNAVVRLLESFAWGAAILAAMLATTGQQLTLDVLTVVPLVVLTVASALGIGFVFAGLALVYKRIDNLFGPLEPSRPRRRSPRRHRRRVRPRRRRRVQDRRSTRTPRRPARSVLTPQIIYRTIPTVRP